MLRSEILDLTKQTLEGSSIHAIPNIIRNRFFLIKFVWFVFFLVSFGFCSWFMIKGINDYLSFSVTSLVEISYENKLEFPIVTICYLNLIKSDSINELIAKYLGEFPSIDYLSMAKVRSSQFYYSGTLSSLYSNETIIYCRFNNLKCDLNHDFEQFYDFNYGNCLKFNSRKNNQKFSYQNGVMSGLVLDLFVGSADQNNNMYSVSNGMNIFITNQSHFESNYLEGVNISPGTTTKISFEKLSLKKQQKPYSECSSNLDNVNSYDSEIYKKTFDANGNRSYSFIDCKIVCLQKIYAEECNCQVVNSLVYTNKLRVCLNNDSSMLANLNDFDCLTKAFGIFSKNSDYIKSCDCPIECEKTYYKYSSSIAEFPTLKYSNYLKNSSLIRSKLPNNISFDDLKKNVARVEIFYDELKQTIISEQVKMEITDLIANLGGTLGLFLGKKEIYDKIF